MGEILFPRGFFFVFWRRARKQGSFDPGVKLSCGDDIPADRLTDFNCSREIIRFRVKSGGGIVGQREFPVTLLRIFTGRGEGERGGGGALFHVVTRFPILPALNTNANTVIDAARGRSALLSRWNIPLIICVTN